MSKAKKEKPKAIYEPGELDKTRKNIGEISPEEAMAIAKKLGGEIGVEKAQDFSTPLYKNKKKYVKRGHKPSTILQKSSNINQTDEKKERVSQAHFKKNKNHRQNILPTMHSQSRKLLDTLMSSQEYRIKPNYGIFTSVVNALQGNQEKVSPQFILYNLQHYFLSLQKFHIALNNMLNYTTEDFKRHLAESKTNYYKAIGFISQWDIKELQEHYQALEKNPKAVTIIKLIPFTKTLFRLILPIYYLGEETIISYIKQIYTDNAAFLKTSKEAFINHTKEAASHWIYIYGQIAKGMYPILLRMTSNDFVEYPAFYLKRTAKILQFLNLSKFDILIPESKETKPKPKIKREEENKEIEKQKEEEKIKTSKEEKTDSLLIAKGLDILDTLFPDAGWKNIASAPDLYPYFQPIYNFADGFNLLAPSNPMQVTIILHRILEDFFQALRNMRYSIDKEPEFIIFHDDINAIFSEWSAYREYQFERVYLPELKEYVNQAYTQSEFVKTPYARKLMSNFFWQTKHHFLPHLSFELIFMEKPSKDTSHIPFPNRVHFLKKIYKTLVNRVEQNLSVPVKNGNKNDDNYGAQGLYLPYRFDIPNPVSKRVDILLNKKKGKNANNLNLIKYTVCILAVLDWWVNNKESPANKETAKIPYRLSPEDGTPVFYVTERTDLDKVFIQNVKAKLLRKEAQDKAKE
jgi:hypothetical protein